MHAYKGPQLQAVKEYMRLMRRATEDRTIVLGRKFIPEKDVFSHHRNSSQNSYRYVVWEEISDGHRRTSMPQIEYSVQ